MNKKGMTLIEVLLSLLIFGTVMILSMGVMTLMLRTSRVTIDNYRGRSHSFENLYYLIQDIQSSDVIEILDADENSTVDTNIAGKKMKVVFHDGKREIKYEIGTDNYFRVDEEELFRVDGAKSSFKFEYDTVTGKSNLRLVEINLKIIGEETAAQLMPGEVVDPADDTKYAVRETLVKTRINVRGN